MRRALPFALAAFITAVSVPAPACTWCVPGHCPTIQAGIDSAAVGDTVLVASDTYFEHDIVMESGVCLVAETGRPGATTIDAQQLGRVIWCMGIDHEAVIEGFTITGGAVGVGSAREDSVGGGIYMENSFPTVSRCTFSGNTASLAGGGMFCLNSSPTLTDCVFSDNTADVTGGGLFTFMNCDLTMTDCTFSGNISGEGGGMSCMMGGFPELRGCTFSGNSGYDGGGMISFIAFPTLSDCTFSGNSATSVGGGMTISESFPTLTDCFFSDNTAGESGGGLRVGSSELSTITGCRFLRNTAESGGGVWVHSGGNLSITRNRLTRGHRLEQSDAAKGRETMFTDCSFVMNQATNGGGLHCEDEETAVLTNCTFQRNAASEDGGGICCEGWTRAVLTSCIISFSEGGGAARCAGDATITLTCSDVYGNNGGDWDYCIADQGASSDNFSEDPLYCIDANPEWPLTLWSNSPCAAENNPTCGRVGAWDIGCSTPVEAASWGAIKAMYR